MFRSHFGYGNGCSGWGNADWGCSPLLFGFQMEGVPYFAWFPPVYYGITDRVSISESVDSVTAPSPPLRIANPYYVEPKPALVEPKPEQVAPKPERLEPKPERVESQSSKPNYYDSRDWPF
jgi:hypothetical protein